MFSDIQDPPNVFRRTPSLKWIGGLLGFYTAWLVSSKTNFANASPDWVSISVIFGSLAVALGLWLPARIAPWPLRVLAALMSVAFILIFQEAWNELSSKSVDSTASHFWDAIHKSYGAVFYSFPAMWFAITGRIGWREDHRLIVI